MLLIGRLAVQRQDWDRNGIFSGIVRITIISLLALAASLWHGPARAYLPPGEPTYFAGNPSTRQLSFRYRIGMKALGWSSDNTGIYGLFSQSSFWFLDFEDLGYTVENNFEPEVQFFADGALLSKAMDWWPQKLDLSMSYSHLSNGINGSLSRSWNHINGGLYLGDPDQDPLCGSLIGWFPFNVEIHNPDITRYAGYGQLTFYVRPPNPLWALGRTQVYLASNFTFDSPDGGLFTNLEMSLSFAPGWLARPPFPKPESSQGSHQPETQFGFFVQWVVGRGESLIDYRQYQNTVRFGLHLW
jgi:outer membrane phospholipase A